MPNTPQPGLCPIFPTERTWWIDGYRGRHAVLRVKRKQFPLAPAFATTAHQAQGGTKKAVIADLQLGRGVSSIASYVAITRVKRRAGLLIYRDFDLEPFQQGIPEGTDLLLKVLSKEKIDWDAIEQQYIPRKVCANCGNSRVKEEFPKNEFGPTKKKSICFTCMEECRHANGEFHSFYCTTCETTRSCDDSTLAAKSSKTYFKRSTCRYCGVNKVNNRWCSGCNQNKPRNAFSTEQRNKRKAKAQCEECCKKKRSKQSIRPGKKD